MLQCNVARFLPKQYPCQLKLTLRQLVAGKGWSFGEEGR